MMDKLQGFVKWFNTLKGFGFIVCDGKEYFVHYKSIQGTGYKELKDGQAVSFSGSQSPKGLVASDVFIIN